MGALARISGVLRRWHRNDRGGVAIIYGASFSVLAGFTALGIEAGDWYVTRNTMKNAADVAAFAVAVAAADLPTSELQQVAFAAARSAGYTGTIDGIQVINPVESDYTDHLPSAVRSRVQSDGQQVVITQQKPLLLAQLVYSDATAVTLEVVSVAAASLGDEENQVTAPECLVGLEATEGATAIHSNGAAFTIPGGCTIHSNSNMQVNGNNQSIANAPISVSGTFNSGAVTPTNLSTGAAAFSDPFADNPAIRDFDPDDHACTHTDMKPGGVGAIPTTYDATTRADRTFVFCGSTDFRNNTTFVGPAIYIFKHSFDISNAVVTGEDVTFILADMSPSSVRVTGNGTLNLIAPRLSSLEGLSETAAAIISPWVGIALFGDPETFTGGTAFNPSSATLGGTFNLNVAGTVYTPGAGLNIQGDVSSNTPGESISCLRIIGRRVEVSGSVSLDNSDCGGEFGSGGGVITQHLLQPAIYF